MNSDLFHDLFPRTPKPIIGMLHLAGENPVKRALDELQVFEEEGLDGVIVENYHSNIRFLARALRMVSTHADHVVVGVNVLPNEFRYALTLAARAQASFVQLYHVAGSYKENYNTSSLDDDIGLYTALRARYPYITVLGGVHPKYYSLVPSSDLEADLQAGMQRADAIVVTGAGTGQETPVEKIITFRHILGKHPLIVGAGLTPANAYEQLRIADGAIVGSWLKVDNDTSKELDCYKIRDLMVEVYRARPSTKTL